ncbi:MAG TPA: hypothetical protein VJK00_14815, partial [Steroidobacteraceae bacterium]|nr:hypothetical protein [Steroidobacteraceae bacterium]
MIGYITLGTSNLKRAATFYDALLAEVGAKRYMESEKFVAWAVRPDLPALGVIRSRSHARQRHDGGARRGQHRGGRPPPPQGDVARGEGRRRARP